MNPTEIRLIAEKISRGNAIAFIGAGASFTANDPYTEKLCHGLPTAGQLVDLLMKEKPYIKDYMPFNKACFLVKSHENKSGLLKFLQDNLNTNIAPLPCHRLLAELPFQAYVSMNFDRLLEEALRDIRKKYRTVINDKDVSLLENSEIPVIKPHGCFSIPDSIVASKDDELPFLQKFLLVDCLLKAKLANKTVIFIGFSLQDNDFEELYLQIHRSLGDMAPNSYAIFKHPSDFEKEYWKNKKVTVIDFDAGQFLKEIKSQISRSRATDIPDLEKDDWFRHPFFVSLHNIKNLPTETQLIDAFLAKFLDELHNEITSLSDLVRLGIEGRDKVYNKKQNFEAFKKVADEIIDGLTASGGDIDKAETFLIEYKEKRTAIAKAISRKWSQVVTRGDNILLFSQSKRVSQILETVNKFVQRSCRVYVAECRPKSSGLSFFQDGFETIEQMSAVDYEMILYPDILVGHLFNERKISKVVMGAHTVFVNASGDIEYFVNTAGSLVISLLCEKYGIPLFIVAEKDKERDVSYLGAMGPISTAQEVEIVDEQGAETLARVRQKGYSVQIMNVGYDLVPAFAGTAYINEI